MHKYTIERTMLIPGAIGEMLVSARTTGKIAVADRYGLRAAILDDTLSEEERRAIDRLLRAILKGKVKVENELSVIG